jgi:hypothetical protein
MSAGEDRRLVTELLSKIVATKNKDAETSSYQVLGNLIKAIDNPAERADNKDYQEAMQSLQEIVNNSASSLVKDKIVEIAQAAQQPQEAAQQPEQAEATKDGEKPVEEITPEQLARIQDHLQQKIEDQLRIILPALVETHLSSESDDAVAVSVEPSEAESKQVAVESTPDQPKEDMKEVVKAQMKQLIDKLLPDIVKEKQAEIPPKQEEDKEEDSSKQSAEQPKVDETSPVVNTAVTDEQKEAAPASNEQKKENQNEDSVKKAPQQPAEQPKVDETSPVVNTAVTDEQKEAAPASEAKREDEKYDDSVKKVSEQPAELPNATVAEIIKKEEAAPALAPEATLIASAEQEPVVLEAIPIVIDTKDNQPEPQAVSVEEPKPQAEQVNQEEAVAKPSEESNEKQPEEEVKKDEPVEEKPAEQLGSEVKHQQEANQSNPDKPADAELVQEAK